MPRRLHTLQHGWKTQTQTFRRDRGQIPCRERNHAEVMSTVLVLSGSETLLRKDVSRDLLRPWKLFTKCHVSRRLSVYHGLQWTCSLWEHLGIVFSHLLSDRKHTHRIGSDVKFWHMEESHQEKKGKSYAYETTKNTKRLLGFLLGKYCTLLSLPRCSTDVSPKSE